MADESKSIPLMAECSESTPLIAECSSNEVSEQSDLDVQQCERSTTESDKGDSSSVAATDEGDVNIERTRSSGDSDDRKELIPELEINETEIPIGEAEVNEAEIPIEEAEVNEAEIAIEEAEVNEDEDNEAEIAIAEVEPNEVEIALGEVSQGYQQPIMMERIRPNPSRDAGELASSAAYASLTAATSCRGVMCDTYEAINKAQKRVDRALRKAQGAAEYDESVRYRALANRYDDAMRISARRARQVDEAAETAEKAAKAAETAARQIVEELNEDSNEADRLLAAHNAATAANMAAIAAYKTEYRAVSAMKRCWEDLDCGNVEPRGLPTRHPDETHCGGNENGKLMPWILTTVLLLLGICILAAVLPNMKNLQHKPTVTGIGTILILIPMCFFLYQIYMCCKNELRKCEQEETNRVIGRIDLRLGQLRDYFANNNITPVHSDEEQ